MMDIKKKTNPVQQILERADLGRVAGMAVMRHGSTEAMTAAKNLSMSRRIAKNDIKAPLGAGYATWADNVRFMQNGADALHALGRNQRDTAAFGELAGVNKLLQKAGEALMGTSLEARAEGHGGWADGLALAAEQLALHARGEHRAAGSPRQMIEGLSDLAEALPHLEGEAKKAALLGMDALSQGLQESFFGPSEELLATLFGGGGMPGQMLPFGAMDFMGFAPLEQAFSSGFARGFQAGMAFGGDSGGFGMLDNPFFAGAFPAMPGGLLYAGQGDFLRAVGMLI
ncbi:MAG: hypothetical protein AAFZ18_32315 [Myxococcota bacterium]